MSKNTMHEVVGPIMVILVICVGIIGVSYLIAQFISGTLGKVLGQ